MLRWQVRTAAEVVEAVAVAADMAAEDTAAAALTLAVVADMAAADILRADAAVAHILPAAVDDISAGERPFHTGSLRMRLHMEFHMGPAAAVSAAVTPRWITVPAGISLAIA